MLLWTWFTNKYLFWDLALIYLVYMHVLRPLVDTKILGSLSPLYKMAKYLHLTYPNPPAYFILSLAYVQDGIKYNCYVNNCQHAANTNFGFGTSWNFFFQNIFNLPLTDYTQKWISGLYSNFIFSNLGTTPLSSEATRGYQSTGPQDLENGVFFVPVQELPWWLSSEEFAWNAGDAGWIPWSGSSPGDENDNPLRYSCLGTPMDREA